MKTIWLFLMLTFSSIEGIPSLPPPCNLEIVRQNVFIVGFIKVLDETEVDKGFYKFKSPVDGKFLVFVPEDRVCEDLSLKGKELQIVNLLTHDLPLNQRIVVRAQVEGYIPFRVLIKEWRQP